jgi:hypothetical protein
MNGQGKQKLREVSDMVQQDPALRELRLISKVLILANAGAIEKELSKIATTDERKKMWVLIDGKHMPKEIADQAGVTQMAVSNFVNAGVASELIEYTKGKPPIRTLSYVPPEWTSLVTSSSSEASETHAASETGGSSPEIVKNDKGDGNGERN